MGSITSQIFKEEYKKLNPLQKEAVDTIDGPVMVVAGPGTGKTQILALRIGNILAKTQTGSDGILCLTFTRSGVKAMKDRLRHYLGPTGGEVEVATFHSFGMDIVQKFYQALDLEEAPEILEDSEATLFLDEILEKNDWQYIRPRGDVTRYFRDLRSMISIIKRERLSATEFLKIIDNEIANLKESKDSISTRGESKGEIKKEVLKKIEGLDRTKEAIKFFDLYEAKKKEENYFDYDDVLEALVKLVDSRDEVKEYLQVKYLYVLIDEHQDSSDVQNRFLEAVWMDVEKPNIFVVGDDRQLIYGFGGASLEYFKNFKHVFGGAKLITLVQNYRSTQPILDASHKLLKSVMSEEKLVSNRKEKDGLMLVEADYPRDEILAACLAIQEKVKNGLDINECAILVPKNKHVRSAVSILRSLGLPVASFKTLQLFDSPIARAFLRVLKIVGDPYDDVALSQSFFDGVSEVPPLEAHRFIRSQEMKNFSLDSLRGKKTLFEDKAEVWVGKLFKWLDSSQSLDLLSFVQLVGDELLLQTSKDHETLVERVEILRTFINLISAKLEKNPNLSLREFLDFLDRLDSYDENIALAAFQAEEGVKVLTLHSSKGLEFDFVWIAHMDEASFMSSKRLGFTLPEVLSEKIEQTDEHAKKRELYVAITRARRYVTISYARHSYTGSEQELARIVADLNDGLFITQTALETESKILASDPKIYVANNPIVQKTDKSELTTLVGKEYEKRNVSVSLLNNFFECPWKWYFRNLLQLPEAKSESLIFGDKVHKAIDQILKLKTDPKKADLDKILRGDKEVGKIIMNWVKERLPGISKKRQNEQSVSFIDEDLPNLNIYGRIDLIENLGEEKVRVTDFKTGSPKRKSDIEKRSEEGRLSNLARQLAMYSYLLQTSPAWKNVVVEESRLEFLEAKDPKESIYNHNVSKGEIDLLKKDIKDYDQAVKNGTWITRECHYNSYGKNTECEYCKMAEIYNVGPLSSQPK